MNELDDIDDIGSQMRRLRLEAGITQAELARRTGIRRSNITRFEMGRHNPTIGFVTRVAQGIGFRLRFRFVPTEPGDRDYE